MQQHKSWYRLDALPPAVVGPALLLILVFTSVSFNVSSIVQAIPPTFPPGINFTSFVW